jgi:ADP-heptose:LPS heptosyltransferase
VRTLVARLDSDGDVLLAGPAVRAVAAGSTSVTLLVSPAGEQAARLLPGVDEVLVYDCPFTGFVPPPVDADDTLALVERLRGHDCAVVLTSYHQSPLPLALLLRLAGVPRIVASSEDYPGSLLDVRHPPGGPHEVQRGLSLAAAAGFPCPSGTTTGWPCARRCPPARWAARMSCCTRVLRCRLERPHPTTPPRWCGPWSRPATG